MRREMRKASHKTPLQASKEVFHMMSSKVFHMESSEVFHMASDKVFHRHPKQATYKGSLSDGWDFVSRVCTDQNLAGEVLSRAGMENKVQSLLSLPSATRYLSADNMDCTRRALDIRIPEVSKTDRNHHAYRLKIPTVGCEIREAKVGCGKPLLNKGFGHQECAPLMDCTDHMDHRHSQDTYDGSMVFLYRSQSYSASLCMLPVARDTD